MALTAPQKLAIRAAVGDYFSQRAEPFDVRKPDLDAAIAAIDAWIDANAASFNAAIPLPARSQLTALQKTHLFHLVAMRRFSG